MPNPIFIIEPIAGRALLVSREDSRCWLRFEAALAAEGIRTIILSGPIAEMLYIALAGHRYGSAPAAWPDWARMARAYIAERSTWHWQARLAHRAIIDWGEYIQPYLGLTVVVQDNRERIDATEAHRSILIDLATNSLIPILSQFSVTPPNPN